MICASWLRRAPTLSVTTSAQDRSDSSDRRRDLVAFATVSGGVEMVFSLPHGAADEFVTSGRSELGAAEERAGSPWRSFSSISSPPSTATHRERGPGFRGLEGPECLAWLGEQPEATSLMGANTYRQMSGFAAGEVPNGQDEFRPEKGASVDELTQASKVVFSSSSEEPLAWANCTLVRGDAVEAVRATKEMSSGLLATIGSLGLCRSLLRAGLVDRFRVVLFR